MNHDDKIALEHLARYRKKYGPFNVMYTFDKNHHVHMVYPSEKYDGYASKGEQPTDRNVFFDEVVIETDLEEKESNITAAKRIRQCLEAHELKYTVWDSGNKSIHHHLFFPGLKKFKDEPRRLAQMKERIMRWILYCDRTDMKRCSRCIGLLRNGMPCLIRADKVDLQLCNNHMIRMEGGWHHKTGRHKTLVHESVLRDENTYPVELEKDMSEEVPQIALNERKPSQRCVQYLLNTKLPDCKKRALFLLCGLLRRDGREPKEVLALIILWNKLQGDVFHKQEIQDHIERAFSSRVNPGCTYCSSLMAELGRGDLCCRI